MQASNAVTALRWVFWLGGALPGLWLGWRYQAGQLGVMPNEVLLHLTGRFALLALIATLALGFVQWVITWRPLYAARRPLGVWTFLYASAHAAIWFLLDQGGVLGFALMELAEMTHIKLGLAALALMLPLALTSVDAAPRLIGLKLWKRLHLLVWPAAAIVIAHTWVVSRFENRLVIVLTLVVLFLMATRIFSAWQVTRDRKSGDHSFRRSVSSPNRHIPVSPDQRASASPSGALCVTCAGSKQAMLSAAWHTDPACSGDPASGTQVQQSPPVDTS